MASSEPTAHSAMMVSELRMSLLRMESFMRSGIGVAVRPRCIPRAGEPMALGSARGPAARAGDSLRRDGASDHVPVRLRPRGRLRRRLPRGDGADRARRADRRPHARAGRATTCAPRRWSCAGRCRSARRACTWRSSTRASATARRAIALRTTEEDRHPRRARQRAAVAGGAALRRDRGGRRRRAVAAPAGAGQRDVPRARPLRAGRRARWPPAPSWPTRATRSTPTRSSALDMPLAFLDASGELFAHAVGFDRFGNIMLDVEHAELTESGFRLGHGVVVNGRAGRVRDDVRRRRPRASCCCTRTPTGRWRWRSTAGRRASCWASRATTSCGSGRDDRRARCRARHAAPAPRGRSGRRATARGSWPLAGAPHGALVTAAAQTAGRGRQGRGVDDAAGAAVAMSLVLRDPPPARCR